MHALPSHPKNPLLLGALVLACALLLLAAAAPELGTLDFSIGGSEASPAPPPELGEPRLTPQPQPNWLTEPLTPPLQGLAR